MKGSFETSIVRIRAGDGYVVGAGFLVGTRQVLTCAHVITQALHLAHGSARQPQELVSLDFPLISPHTLLTARVVLWCPPQADGRGDIAGLELQDDPPAGAEQVRFASAEDVWGHPFRAFGFPSGQDDGVWASGRLLGRQATDWLMIEDVKAPGFAIVPGFSGTPVWDTQLQGVIGMIVAASRPEETKTAFVLPLDVLLASWPLVDPLSRQRLFLSSAPADIDFSARLATDLQKRGIIVWSEQQLPCEESINKEERVRQAIRAALAVILVVSTQTRSSRIVREHLRLADLYRRRLILVWVGDDKYAQPHHYGWSETTWIDTHRIDYLTVLEVIEDTLNQRRSLSALPGPADVEDVEAAPRNPYKGLHAFTASDVHDFFGRDRLVAESINDIIHLVDAEQGADEPARLLTLIGSSGSGKSSVLMAGILPRLRQGAVPGSETWVYLEPMVPGRYPIESLSLTLAPHFPGRSITSVRSDLEDDSTRGLHLLAIQLLKQRNDRVVLSIDQFEELFTQTESQDERQQFIDLLLTASTERNGPLLVLLTLRADFYDRPMQYPALSRLMQAHMRQVLPMELEDLRAVIEQPASLPDVQLILQP